MMTSVATPVKLRDLSAERQWAIELAVTLHQASFTRGDTADVITTSDVIFTWLTEPIYWRLVVDRVIDEDTGQTRKLSTTGGPLMAQLRAGKKLHVHLEAFDSRGNSVPDDPATTSDNIGWTLADGGDAVIGLTVDDDSRGATLRWVGLGSTVLTAAIPTSRGNREVTLALDAIPGEINSLEITVGDEEDDDGSAPV